MKHLTILMACWLLFAGGLTVKAQHLVTDELTWIEGEQPDATDVPFDVSATGRPQLLSNGKLLLRTLNKNQIPKQPWELSYTFNVKHNDTYGFWIRLEFEWVRAPFEWKIDEGDWHEASADVQTTQLMELATWNEIAWAHYGDVKLSAGRHKLTLRFSKGGMDGRQLVGIDCIVFGRADFDPARMYHIAKQPIDTQAQQQVYRFGPPALTPARRKASLDGLWQVARYDDPDMDQNTYDPVPQLPDLDKLRWLGMDVPGKRQGAWAQRVELSFGHRLIYRTRVQVPDVLAGHAFILHFGATNWIVSVFVNGKLVTTHKSVLVPWSADVTDGIEPGKVNEIAVAVKGPWYSIDYKANKGRTRSLDHARNTPANESFLKHRSYVAPVFPSTKGQGNGMLTGIIGSVWLTATGSVYVDDIFVQSKVRPAKQLAAQITLHNSSNRSQPVQWLANIVDHKTLKPIKTDLKREVTVPAGKSQSLTVDAIDVADAKLWWPDAPQLYDLKCTLISGGKVIDHYTQTFGVREIALRGKDFLLNGIPWHFWNWVGVHGTHDPQQWLEQYHKQGDRFHRTAQDHDKLFGTRSNALNFFDTNGIPNRLSTCIDGMFITQDLNNPLVWDNFEEHVRQVVKAYRNHPGVMMYSLGNEEMFVTAYWRNWKNYRQIEQKMQHLSDVAKQLDPTRDSFQDGGGDLGGLGAINCQHYSLPKGATFPLAAYAYPTGKPNGQHNRAEVFKWSGSNPLVLGEVFYYSGNLSEMAWVGGPSVYRGRSNADIAAGKYLNIAMQGARWQGVTAICPWTAPLPGVAPAFSPRAVFIRQQNDNVYPNSSITRTIKVFNDTRFDDPMTFTWQLLSNGTVVGQGQKVYQVAAGHSQKDTLTIPTPQVLSDMDLTLRLLLTVKGQAVFADEHTLHVLFPEPVKANQFGVLSVFDPSGKVVSWLQKKQAAFTRLNSPLEVDARLDTLLIGPGALDHLSAKDHHNLMSVFKVAKHVIVLEQANPVTGKQLGIDLHLAGKKQDAGKVDRGEFEGAKGSVGQIAFIAAPAHPVFKGMHNDQFFTWAHGSYNFTNSYATPTSGMLLMISAGHDLNLCPMVQITKGASQIVLSQMLIGSKLGVEPLADRLLTRLLNAASQNTRTLAMQTAIFTAGDAKLDSVLRKTGLQFDAATDMPSLFKLMGSHKIMVIKAASKNMAWLNTNKKLLDQWTQAGGRMMLVNLDKQGIDDFDLIVGFPHQIRPGTQERVRLENMDNPLLLGISDRDIAMDADKFIARWRNQRYISDRVFSNVVDGREVASFAKMNGKYRNMVNGLLNDDFWRYICYLAPDETIHMSFGHPQRLDHLNIWTNETYQVIKTMKLIFDGDPKTAVNLDLADTSRRQTFPLNGHTAQSLDIQLTGIYDKSSHRNLTGIDNLEIFRQIPDDMAARFVMLAKPGGLVVYPMGKGYLLLNNLDYQRPDTSTNQKKKLGIWSNLLQNMGAGMGH